MGKFLMIKSNFANTIKNKFYSCVSLPNKNGCMEWVGETNGAGYGYFCIKDPIASHRFSYELHLGSIPDKLCVMHKCDNRKCVAPEHLKIGTHKDNSQDMVRKGRNLRLNYARGEKCHLSKITTEQVVEMIKLHNEGAKVVDLSKKFNLTPGHVRKIVKRRAWNHIKGE